MKTTYYLVYKLTNMVNSKIYIGCHMTKCLDDGYMGSGRRLANAKKKHGIESFKKEILSFHETPEEMLAEEARLVNEEFLGRDDVYNLTVGGKGSWFLVNLNLSDEELKSRQINGGQNFKMRLKTDDQFAKLWSEKRIQQTIVAKNAGKYKNNGKNWIGLKHSEETKERMRISRQGTQQGSKNSQFGSMWITNDVESKKIKNDEPIPTGWRKGRVKKNS